MVSFCNSTLLLSFSRRTSALTKDTGAIDGKKSTSATRYGVVRVKDQTHIRAGIRKMIHL